jgi:Tfp pilus assembly protein PilF
MVGGHIGMELDLQRARAETPSDAAYAHYERARRLQSRLFVGGTSLPAPLTQILDDVDAALAIDPDFVSALYLRANTYTNGVAAPHWDVAAREARKSIDRALEVAPNDPRLLGSLAYVQMQMELDPAAAEATYERIRRIDPHYVALYEGRAALAMQRGEPREAMQHWQEHISESPDEAPAHFYYGQVLVRQLDWDGAEREFNTTIRLMPKGGFAINARLSLVTVSVRRGDLAKASALFAPLWAEFQHVRPAFLAYPLALLGREAEARALIDGASRDCEVNAAVCVLTYSALKDYDDALVWLRRGIDDRNQFILQAVRMPNALPGLQESPGYADVLAYLDSLQRSR